MWGLMREWLEMRRGKLWDNEDNDLLGELTTPTFKILSDGKIAIEKKEDMKKRGLPSPNIADAHILTFAQPVAAYQQDDDEEELTEWRQGWVPLDAWAGY